MRWGCAVLVFTASCVTHLVWNASFAAAVVDGDATGAALRSRSLLAILAGAALRHRAQLPDGRAVLLSDWDPHMSQPPAGVLDAAAADGGRIWNIPSGGSRRRSTYKSADVPFLRALSGDAVRIRRRSRRSFSEPAQDVEASAPVESTAVDDGGYDDDDDVANDRNLLKRADFARRVVLAALKYKTQNRIVRKPYGNDLLVADYRAVEKIPPPSYSPIAAAAPVSFSFAGEEMVDTCPLEEPGSGSLLRAVYNTWRRRSRLPSSD